MISITHNRKFNILQGFIIIISIATCGYNTIDYDLPTKFDVDNYVIYHFRPYTRYDQQKLDPYKFFKSIYNLQYRVLPEPHLKPDYNIYRKNFQNLENEIDLEALLSNYHIAKQCENSRSPDEMDDRYVYEDPDLYQVTDKMYHESEIYEKEYEVAKQYIGDNKERQPLAFDDFINLWILFELLPKHYETGVGFYKTRIGFGQFIIDNTPITKDDKTIILTNHKYKTELIELSTKDVLIKGESYGQYVLRMVHIGKIPLDPQTCNELYGTHYENDCANSMFFDLKLNFTPLSQPSSKFESQSSSPTDSERSRPTIEKRKSITRGVYK